MDHRLRRAVSAVALGFAALGCLSLLGAARQGTTSEVTLKGMVVNNIHTGEAGKAVYVYALGGPPEVTVVLDRMLAEVLPERGLDAERARRLLDLWTTRLRYTIDGPLADKLCEQATYNARQVMAVTGTVSERGGVQYITVNRCEPTPFTFPAWMMAPDRPAATQDRPPLVLKVSDQLSLRCVWVPPGRFLMGEPYYQCPHWQESPPHMVTLTHGFYVAEHPVTQAMFAAIVGRDAGKATVPSAPANVSCADMAAFCRALSARTGRRVRVPTAAEWEYAARVGTSNPTFREKYQAQDSSAVIASGVKQRSPNAWGLYDMVSSGWERVSDNSAVIDRHDVNDPRHIPPEDTAEATMDRKHGHVGKGNEAYSIDEFEYITNERGPVTTYPGVIRFRIVVEDAR